MKIKLVLLCLLSSILFSCENDDDAGLEVVDYYVQDFNVDLIEDSESEAVITVSVNSNWNLLELKVMSEEYLTQSTYVLTEEEDNLHTGQIRFFPSQWSPGVLNLKLSGVNSGGNLIELTGPSSETEITITFGEGTQETQEQVFFNVNDQLSNIDAHSSLLVLDYEKNCTNCESESATVNISIVNDSNVVQMNEEYLLSTTMGSIEIELAVEPNEHYQIIIDNPSGLSTYSNLPETLEFQTPALNTIDSISIQEELILTESVELTMLFSGNPTIGGSVNIEVVDPQGTSVFNQNTVLADASSYVDISISDLNPNTEYQLMVSNVAGSEIYDDLDFSYSFETLNGIFDATLSSAQNITPTDFDIAITYTNSTGESIEVVVTTTGSVSGEQSTVLNLAESFGLSEITTTFSGLVPGESVIVQLHVGSTTIDSESFSMNDNEFTNVNVTTPAGDTTLDISPGSTLNILSLTFEALANSSLEQITIYVKPETETMPWERFLILGASGNSISVLDALTWQGPNQEGYYYVSINQNEAIMAGNNEVLVSASFGPDEDTTTSVVDIFSMYAEAFEQQGHVISPSGSITLNLMY